MQRTRIPLSLALVLALVALSCHAPKERAAPQHPVVVDVAWEPPKNTAKVESYVVYKRPTVEAAEQFACEVPKGTHTCVDPAPLEGTSFYTVYSWGQGVWSKASNMVRVEVVDETPTPRVGAPRQLKVIKVTIQSPPPPPPAP